MTNSWDAYYAKYDYWDSNHSFIIRIKLSHENDIKKLGYKEKEEEDQIFDNDQKNTFGFYERSNKDLKLNFQVPYEWAIDFDWEDQALELLNIDSDWVEEYGVDGY